MQRSKPPLYLMLAFLSGVTTLVALLIIVIGAMFALDVAKNYYPAVGAMMMIGSVGLGFIMLLFASLAGAVRDLARNSWWLRQPKP